MTFERSGQRAADQLRAVRITRGYTIHAEGSVLIEFGNTKVLCTASVEEKVPPHKRGSGEGWVTAEYGMLPRSTHTRSDREAARGKQSGRTQEIQRLIGRSLRAVFDLKALGERTIQLDCDVIQADGGTRTAAITGAFVAAQDAVNGLLAAGKIAASPITAPVAAVRVPPSACSTSQSRVMVRSPRACRSNTARRLRPIRRWISCVRPLCLPRAASRSLRACVARGNMPYSAVTQPWPLPRRKDGTDSSTLAVHSTLVLPISMSTEPSAWQVKRRTMRTSRSCAG